MFWKKARTPEKKASRSPSGVSPFWKKAEPQPVRLRNIAEDCFRAVPGRPETRRGGRASIMRPLSRYFPAAMSRFAACLFSLVIVPGLIACNPTVEDDRPGQPVKHRQAAFKALLRASEPVGVMLRDGQFSAERLATLGETLSRASEAPWLYYGPDTDYPPSKSRPDVWRQPEKFAAERQRFLAAVEALRAAADERAAQAAYDDVRARCKSCHDAFRR
jgi:cytochrome c556